MSLERRAPWRAAITATLVLVSAPVLATAAHAIPILNKPPVALASATPNPAHVDEVVTLDGSGSTDPETSPGNLLYRWDFGDGTEPTSSATGNFEVDHAYATAGVYTATLTVTDPDGASDTDQVVIEVDDTAPVAAATATPTTAYVQQAVAFDASATTDAETADDGLSFAWTFGDGATGSGVAPSHAYAAAGSYTVGLEVTDPQGASDSLTLTVTVTNSAPTANGTITPAAPHVGETVTFDGTASTDTETPDGLTYDWDFGDGSTHATTATATHVYSAVGTRTVKLKVTDPQGLTHTRTFSVAVAANGAPTANATASQAKANVGQAVTFDSAGSTDPEGTSLTYSWDFGDGTADATTDVAEHAFAAPGTYTVTLTVTDAHGRTGTDTVTVTIGNEAPVAAMAISPNPGRAMGTISFDGSASTDSETPDQLTYSWVFGDGESTAYSTNPQATHVYAAAGTYTVTLRVKDAKGALDTTTSTVEALANTAPVADASATPTEVHVGGSVTFDGSGSSDADGDALTYAWDLPGDATASTATAEHTFDSAGSYEVTLTVSDEFGGSDSAVVTVTVVNDAPTAAFTRSTGLHVVGRAVTLDATPSGDTETPDDLTYEWDFGDGSTGTGVTASHSYTSAGSWTATLTVTDPQGGSATTQHVVHVARKLGCGSSSVTRSSHWRVVRDGAAAGGWACDNRRIDSGGAGTMTLSASGKRVGLTFGRSSRGGSAEIYVDGVLKGTVSFRSAASSPTYGHNKVFTGLGVGEHTIELRMVSGVGYVDHFLVYGS